MSKKIDIEDFINSLLIRTEDLNSLIEINDTIIEELDVITMNCKNKDKILKVITKAIAISKSLSFFVKDIDKDLETYSIYLSNKRGKR